MKTEFRDKLSASAISDVSSLFAQTWWAATRTNDQIGQLLENSTKCYGAYHGNKLVAFARCLSDYQSCALILDVVVHENLRGTGLGEQIVTEILQDVELKDVELFELHCKENLEAFYSKLGFQVGSTNMIWMRKSPTS